jgi:DNA replication protein DnaC
MAEILLNRYDNPQTPWHYTHITTNLTAAEIEQYYGTRVKSRMREMFNMITLDGEDRRR